MIHKVYCSSVGLLFLSKLTIALSKINTFVNTVISIIGLGPRSGVRGVRSCLSVCLSVCQTITFESLDVRSSYLHIRLYLQEIRGNFVYEGHRVTVKVTGAKRSKIPFLAM